MAGEGVERNQSLKDALLESVTAILSPMQDVRAAGEEQIKALEVTEEFGVHLAELTVDPNGGLAIRQLASVLLKQYVEVHWSEQSEKFRPPETSEQAKAAIRQILPMGLKETVSKVRSSVAYAVSAIAHWDWPEQWPQLFGILMEALTSGNHEAVHGAMRVLTEFCQQVTDNQMPQVAPVILPEMYKIFTQDQVYSIRTRGRAVYIFNTCAGLIAAMNELQKGIAKQLLFPVVPQFTEAFVHALQTPDGWTTDSGLKMDVLKALTTLVKYFPGQMNQWIAQILPPVWSTLTYSADVYVRTVVNNTEEADDPVDSDGEVLGFENLVYSVFEFIHGLIDTVKFRSHVKKSMDQLFYYVILYAQMTEDQERQWTNSPDTFVQDEDEDSFSYSVRISAQDLLLSMCNEFPRDAAAALVRAVTQHLQEAEQVRNSGNQHWWKLHESVMLAIGSVSRLIVDSIAKNKIQFDLNAFLTSVVLNDLNSSVSPFLLGRCLWTASRFTEVTSPELIPRLLEATVKGLEVTQTAPVRISAVRAAFGFCNELKSSEKTAMILPFLPSILDGLIAVATQFSSEVLGLCLETLTIVLSVDDQFTAAVEPKVTPLASAILLKYSSDPFLIALTQDVFKVLSENEMANQPVQQRVIPTIVSILQAPGDKVAVGLQAVALDILQTIVRGSNPPLSDALVNSAFPACVQCTLGTDDNSTVQNGGECLRAYVSVSLEQVCQWQDGQGNNGLYYIVQIISKLLDPKTSEYSATFVGRLVSMVISKMGSQLGENLDLMLRAVLSKMQQAETPSVIQSLVMVFASLLHTQMEAVLEFLSSVPGPTGKPALEFVLTEWCACQHLFYGYEGRVSAIALSKLMLHAVQTNDTRLRGIEVKGDQVFQPAEGIRTRSKGANNPEQWTMIPVLVKIYKLLINELSSQLELQAADGDEEEGEWEDIEEEDVEDVNGGGNSTIQELMSALSGGHDFLGFEREEEEEEDPDALADPLYTVNLLTHLTEFLRSFSQHNCFNMFSAHHTVEEKRVLQQIGINA